MILILILLIIIFLKYYVKENFVCEEKVRIPIEETNIDDAKKKLEEYIILFNNSSQSIRDKQSEIFIKNNILKEILLDVKDKNNIILQVHNDINTNLNTLNLKENICYNSNNIKLSAIRNIYS